METTGDIFSISLGGDYCSDQPTARWHAEPSQVTARLGNWAIYAGRPEQWFGPGGDGVLLFSNAARPMPKIGIKQLEPYPIDLPVLRWLGPVRLDIFAAVLNEQRAFNNTLTIGTRLGFTPAAGVEMGLNRAQMLCSSGRPCGLKQIVQSFVGCGNADNAVSGSQDALLNQPCNQLAGFDISYTHNFGAVATKLYFEGESEDFDNILL